MKPRFRTLSRKNNTSMWKSGGTRVVSAFFLTVTIRTSRRNSCRLKHRRDLETPLTHTKRWVPTQMKDRGWDYLASPQLVALPQLPLMARTTATKDLLSLRRLNNSRKHLTDVEVITHLSNQSKPVISLRQTRASMKRWTSLTTRHTKEISRRKHHSLSGAMRTSRAESSSTHLSMVSDWLSYF